MQMILFWLEVAIGILAVAFTFFSLSAILRRPKRQNKSAARRSPPKGSNKLSERINASGTLVMTELSVVIAAAVGLYGNPYLHEVTKLQPSAGIEQVSLVNGDPCLREVTVRADVPAGDVIAIGSKQQGHTEEDFQSSVTRQGGNIWVSTVEIGDHTEVGQTFFLTPIILPQAQENDLLDVIRTNSIQAQTSTYWPSSGPPSSAVYVGNSNKVTHSSMPGSCSQ